MTIDTLIKIYSNKGFIESADAELFNPNITEKDKEWLKRFIEVWDRMQEK